MPTRGNQSVNETAVDGRTLLTVTQLFTNAAAEATLITHAVL